MLLSLQYRLAQSACKVTRTTRGERNFLSYHLINYPSTSQSERPAGGRDCTDESRPLGGFVPATVPELRTRHYPKSEYDDEHSSPLHRQATHQHIRTLARRPLHNRVAERCRNQLITFSYHSPHAHTPKKSPTSATPCIARRSSHRP